MANSTDFRADQVQTSKIIVTGSNPQKTLLIYGIDADDLLAPNQGNIDPAVFNTSSIGSDVFFFVSGAVGGRGGTDPVIAVIGGDLHISGNLTVDGTYPAGGGGTNFFTEIALDSIETTGSVAMTFLSASTGAEITGSLKVLGGITGSLSGTVAGNPFIVAGSNITANYNSLGQWEITSSGGGGGGVNYFTEIALDAIQTTGSVAMTFLSASAGGIITGSFAHGTDGLVIAGGVDSHAEGSLTTAGGINSHAEGSITSATGDGSHTEGFGTTATGISSHAEGYGAKSSGDASHAEGYGTESQGVYSHAEGYETIATGTGSFAAGLGTVASGSIDGAFPPLTTQAAFGKYNLQGNSDSLFVIGDGFDGLNRHDVLRVNSGSVQVTGSLIAPTITGSIQNVDEAGITPFLINGANITVNYNSLGQWEVTGSGGGSAVVTSSLIDFMDKQGYDPSSLGGSYTIGMGFYVAASSSLTNFKVDWHGLSSKTLSIKLWDQAGTVVGAVSQSVSANASVVGAFTSSISLDPYKYYYLSYWEDSGTDYHLYYSLYTGYAAYKFLGPSAQYYRAVRIRSDVIFSDGYLYSSGDAFPTTTNTDTNIAAIEPIL